jgi:hypothetical protein
MNISNYVPAFYTYKFSEAISAPYTSLQAYKAGAIDERGNIIKPESSIDSFEYLIIKLKKIFDELPVGMTKARLGNYMSTLQIFSEAFEEYGVSRSEFVGSVEGYIALNVDPTLSYFELCEDMASGGMATAGTSTGYNTGAVSGFDPVMGTTKRKQPVIPGGLDNCEMFDVCPKEFEDFKSAKAWKHVPDSETKTYLQRYQRRNPKGKMAIRMVNPDNNAQELYWVNYSSKSFYEQFGLNAEELKLFEDRAE